ncbi:hypothetical protein PFISCL1PPCAC_25337, partial [Pristionchus fissidentatus]
LAMYYDDSAARTYDDNDFSMNEECDHTGIDYVSSPPPSFYSALPSSPIDDEEQPCLVFVEEQRRTVHSIACSPASTSSSPPVVRAFSVPPKRVSWRDHMRDLHRATIDESIHRLSSSVRGGIEKKRRGKGGHVGATAATRRTHRPGCAQHVWSLVKHIKEAPASSCTCHSEVSGVSEALVDRLRRLTRFDPRIVESHRFTYSYQLEYTLPSIAEAGEESGAMPGYDPAYDATTADHPADPTTGERRPGLGRVSRSVSPEPSRPHCSSPTAPEMLQALQLAEPVLSEEEMCARLSALPIGYHTTATVAALESALHSSLSLMDTE